MLLNITKIKALWGKLLHQEASPNQIASGFAIGLFVSFLPIMPFQTIITLLLAYLLRTNKVACLAGLNLHLLVIPIVPLVFVAEYNIGKNLLNLHHVPDLDPERVSLFHLHPLLTRWFSNHWVHNGWKCLRAMLVGSLVLGTPSSFLSFWIVKQASFRWQKARQDQNDRLNEPLPKSQNCSDDHDP